MSSEEFLVKFSCTDRLNETKIAQKEIKIVNKNDKKEYNRQLIEKLKDFQVEVNSLMTEFVEKEKKAVASKELSNDHLKNLNQKSDDSDEESESDQEESEQENHDENNKRNNENLEKDLNEPVEKRLCVDN